MQWQSAANHTSPEQEGRLSNAGKGGLSMQEKAALRNSPDYDDWEFGMEPIPGDTSWTSRSH
jgi:hypothetical protein